jgi:hypothetical protein
LSAAIFVESGDLATVVEGERAGIVGPRGIQRGERTVVIDEAVKRGGGFDDVGSGDLATVIDGLGVGIGCTRGIQRRDCAVVVDEAEVPPTTPVDPGDLATVVDDCDDFGGTWWGEAGNGERRCWPGYGRAPM